MKSLKKLPNGMTRIYMTGKEAKKVFGHDHDEFVEKLSDSDRVVVIFDFVGNRDTHFINMSDFDFTDQEWDRYIDELFKDDFKWYQISIDNKPVCSIYANSKDMAISKETTDPTFIKAAYQRGAGGCINVEEA